MATEAEFEELWKQGVAVLRITRDYIMTRPPLTTPPSAIDELRLVLDQRRLMVRVRRYPLFLADYLRTALLPYAPQIKEVYGMDADEVIGELQKVDNYQKSGVVDKYLESMHLTESLMAKLRAKGYTIGPDESEEDHRRVLEALDSDEFKQLHADVQAQAERTFTAALFEITALTALPSSVLSLLSVKPGEAILNHLTGPDHDDLSPLSTVSSALQALSPGQRQVLQLLPLRLRRSNCRDSRGRSLPEASSSSARNGQEEVRPT